MSLFSDADSPIEVDRKQECGGWSPSRVDGEDTADEGPSGEAGENFGDNCIQDVGLDGPSGEAGEKVGVDGL